MNRQRWRWMGRIGYAAGAAFVYAGFLATPSGQPEILWYSRTYAGFLVVLLGVLSLPLGVMWLQGRLGRRRLLFTLAPTAAVLVLGYGALAQVYYARQTHRFDPFLQAPPPRFARPSAVRRGGEVRILFAGGSTTRNAHLPQGERYPAVVETLLRQRFPDTPLTVFNAGMDWWTTKHSLINYVTYARDWEPDVVVVMHGINDLYRSFSPPEYAVPGYDPLWAHFYGPAMRGARPPTFSRHLFTTYLGDFADRWYAAARYREINYPSERYVSVRQFGHQLERLVHYAQSDGVQPVLVTQPSLYKGEMTRAERNAAWFSREFCLTPGGWLRREYPSPLSLQTGMRTVNDRTHRVAAAAKVPLVDAAAALPKTLEYFRDDVHYTAKGSALVAQLVVDEIARLGVMSPPRTPGETE